MVGSEDIDISLNDANLMWCQPGQLEKKRHLTTLLIILCMKQPVLDLAASLVTNLKNSQKRSLEGLSGWVDWAEKIDPCLTIATLLMCHPRGRVHREHRVEHA
jgi:hypothetical protein